MAAMNPGLSPIYIDPEGTETNVPPPGNTPGWALVARPSQVQPVTTSNLDSSEVLQGPIPSKHKMNMAAPAPPVKPPVEPKKEEPKKEEPKKEEPKKEHHSLFGSRK